MKIIVSAREAVAINRVIETMAGMPARELLNGCNRETHVKVTCRNKDTVVNNPDYDEFINIISNESTEVTIEIYDKLVEKAAMASAPHLAGFYNIGRTIAFMYRSFINSVTDVVNNAIAGIPAGWKDNGGIQEKEE